EALPWWFFGVIGGMLSYWYAPLYLGGHFGLPLPPLEVSETDGSGGMSWMMAALYFAPGLVAGGAIGWLIIRPVNAVLGWLFRGFDRGFDRVTAMYGWMVGKALRL